MSKSAHQKKTNIFLLQEYKGKGIETAISNEILFENKEGDTQKWKA